MVNIDVISAIIKKEKYTNNIIFSLKLKGHEIDTLSLKHSSCLFNLFKLFSQSGFFMELEEPIYVEYENNVVVSSFIDDLIFYCKHLTLDDSKLIEILSILIDIKLNLLKILISENKPSLIGNRAVPTTDVTNKSIVLTIEELNSCNGKDNKPSYVVIENKIYDTSASPAWINGIHFGISAGKDLTEEFVKCHKNSSDILSKLPFIGTLSKE